MMFELLLDVLDRFLNLRDSVFVFEISSLQSSYRCSHLHESYRTLRDGRDAKQRTRRTTKRRRPESKKETMKNRLIVIVALCLALAPAAIAQAEKEMAE